PDRLVLVDLDRADDTRKLARNLDLGERLERAGGRDFDHDVAALDGLGQITDGGLRLAEPQPGACTLRGGGSHGQKGPAAAARSCPAVGLEAEGRLHVGWREGIGSLDDLFHLGSARLQLRNPFAMKIGPGWGDYKLILGHVEKRSK